MGSGNRTTIEAFESEFDRSKRYAESTMSQLTDADLHAQLNPRQNSVAVIIQHLHGNMLSRFTDFLTSDGEKPTRDRDREFVDRNLSRAQLMALWDQGWECVFDAMANLTDADLPRTVTIRAEPHTVALAITRQVAHYAWHAAQIALIGKHLVGERWKYLTIPPGGSSEFNKHKGLVR
ncbi:MAG: DUF1572 family protein [Tepidisphaeraceae bacterium]